MSGSRFYFLTGVGALLQLGMLQMAIQQAVEHGFTPSITPSLVRPEAMEGTGFLGAHASEVYRLEADDLYLVGTSEVPLAAYHSNEILDLDGAGAVRGLVVVLPPGGRLARQGRPRHPAGAPVRQGGDVLVLPARGGGRAEHRRLLAMEEEMLAKVEVPYRVIDVAAGDLGSQRGPQVRLRGVGAVAGPVPRGHLDVELHHVPGATAATSGIATPTASRRPRRR